MKSIERQLDFFYKNLINNHEALEYLKKRQLTLKLLKILG